MTDRPTLIHLDGPEDGARVARRPVIVAGWALDEARPLMAVLVGIDRREWTAARTGLARPDVATAQRGAPDADRAGCRSSWT
jgi:hypothetical protein